MGVHEPRERARDDLYRFLFEREREIDRERERDADNHAQRPGAQGGKEQLLSRNVERF